MTTYTRTAQALARKKIPAQMVGSGPIIPTLAQNLLTFDSFWERVINDVTSWYAGHTIEYAPVPSGTKQYRLYLMKKVKVGIISRLGEKVESYYGNYGWGGGVNKLKIHTVQEILNG